MILLKENYGIEIVAFVSSVNNIKYDYNLDILNKITREDVDKTIIRCPDIQISKKMIKLIDRIRNFFSKDIVIIIIISLLNLSFIRYDWENDTKSRVKIHETISTIFNSSTYTIDSISYNFYTISESERIIGYFIVQSEFSKYKKFDYFIIYNNLFCNTRWKGRVLSRSISSRSSAHSLKPLTFIFF